jgi:D-glycero-D-manno-heptose 1,7-bisphosphate phosphatase
MNKAILLDRDGVINKDKVDYVYKLEELFLLPGVIEALKGFHALGYKIIIITNQSGIAKGIFKLEDVNKCHDYVQEQCGNIIEKFYISPYHESKTASLTRKPGSLMYEKAIAKFDIDISQSWMAGDKARDLKPATKLGLKTALIGNDDEYQADFHGNGLIDLYKKIKGTT